ncbi:MAG: hypothetical protein MJZ76_06005 [Bacteroidales bacterium]|nr:hypothetical protein [Bacteroidales bacterium]
MMKRHVLLFLLSTLLFCPIIWGQNQPKKVKFSADKLDYDEQLLPGVDRFIGNVVFTHGEIIGYCDSAYFYQSRNFVEGFGKKIRIRINDSVTLYGKYMTYDGDLKIATISRDVVLKDKKSSLYTDSLTYLIDKEHAYYENGGRMVSADNVLTSVIGNYYTGINKIVLKDRVKLVNDTYTMDCDSLAYNTLSEIVTFISRTHLVSKENTIYTNAGWYDTKIDVTQLVDSVELYSNTQRLTGDSIYYDKKIGLGIGRSHITLIDKEKDYVLKGNYVEHHEDGGFSTATDSAVLILIDQNDSLYTHADTLKMWFDSLQDPQLMLAYNRVKFYRYDLQGACDSLVFHVPDSILYMYYNPVIWSGSNQLTADTIQFTVIDSVNMKVDLLKAGFIVSSVFQETEFNQIKGLTITGHIFNRELTRVDVSGNAECLYYIQEEDSSLIGVNSSATSEMRIDLKQNEISAISFYNTPDGEINPDESLAPKDRLLKDFRWLIEYRATRPEDIFSHPINRLKY